MKNIIILLLFAGNLYSYECLEEAFKNYKIKKYDLAIDRINNCIESIKNDGDISSIHYAISGLSLNYFQLGIIDSALKYSLIAYDLELENDLSSSKTLNQLGLIYIEKGMNNQAIYYLKKALESDHYSNNSEIVKRNYINTGLAYLNLNLQDSAKVYLVDGINKISSEKNSFELNTNIAYMHFKNREFEKARNILLEFSQKYSFSNQIDSLFNSSNIEILKLYANDSFDEVVFENYLKAVQSNNESIYFADANYKLSVMYSKKNNIKKAIEHLNSANYVYVEVGNITKAKEITELVLSFFKNIPNQELSFSLSELDNIQNSLYSKQLESEIQTKIESDRFIKNLNTDLYYSSMSSYLFASILFSVLISIALLGYKIRTNKEIKSILVGYRKYLNIIHRLDTEKLRYNLAVIANYIVLDRSFENKKEFTNLIDDVINDTNKIRKAVNDGLVYKQNKRLKI